MGLRHRLEALFWGYSPLWRRPARRLLRSASLARHRWRSRSAPVGAPPRVVHGPAAESGAVDAGWTVAADAEVSAAADAGVAAALAELQTEPPVDPATSHPRYTLCLEGDAAAVRGLPATLVESMLMAAVAEDSDLVMTGWAEPAPDAHGPTGDLAPFPGVGTPVLLRSPRPGDPARPAVGRALPHLTSLDGPGTAPCPLPRSGPHILAPGGRPGVVRRSARDLSVALEDLGAVPGPPTVLFLLPFLAVGGAERLLFDLIADWAGRYRVLVVTLEPHQQGLGQTVDRCRDLTPHVYTLGDWLPRDAHGGALGHLIRRWRVETLVSWNGTVFFYDHAADLRRRFPGLRQVAQLYNHEGGWTARTSPEVLRAVDLHVAVNRRTADALEARGGSPDQIATIHHGVDVPTPFAAEKARARRRDRRAELGLGEDTFVVGTFIRLHPQKRPLDIVALSRRFDGENVRFLLVGGGPLSSAVDGELARRPAPSLLRRPLVADVLPLYDALDLCLMTSAYEGLPVFLLDGLARGIPCVAPAVGDIPLLLEGGGGVTVGRPGDLDALEAGIRRLMDPDLRREEGGRGRQRVADRFGLQRFRREYESALFPQYVRRSGGEPADG
ncbi:MAG: glycosyltransferase [Acidobacteriota bacterium]